LHKKKYVIRALDRVTLILFCLQTWYYGRMELKVHLLVFLN